MKFPEKYRVEDFNPVFTAIKKGNDIYSQCYIIPFKGRDLRVIGSIWVGGYEHASVSLPNRCPNWEEMCHVKDFFWDEEEVCIQIHPKKSNYVNVHKTCLHIWKPPLEVIEMLEVVIGD